MANHRPWLVLAGGGTGGHLYPGLAIAEAVRRIQSDFEISVFGTNRPIDREIVTPRGYELVPQAVQPMPSRPWQWPGFLWSLRQSQQSARTRFESRRPAAVLGLGGYAAAPPLLAANKLGIPTALFNPDAEPGLANRRLARGVQQIFVQWSVTSRRFQGSSAALRVTGCPVRTTVFQATRAEGVAKFKLDPAKRTLLITGASQGARSINLACIELINLWSVAGNWQLVHLTGPSDHARVRDAYAAAHIAAVVLPFSEDLPFALAAADLVISRAGASTLAELTARGAASILLPYPHDRRKHQRQNARVLEEVGAAVVLDDAGDPRDNAVAMRSVLRDLMLSDQRRLRMAAAARALGRDDAADVIAHHLLDAARRDRD